MFESVVVEVEDAVGCADALVASVAAERRAVAERFALVAAWADFHSPGHELPETAPTGPAAASTGVAGAAGTAEGVPPVAPDAVVELGMLLQTTTRSAEALVRDVLELRHRLPHHWEAVLTGRVPGWQAREVARLTHRLGHDQARWVDTVAVEATLGLPWGRAKAVVEAKVIAADPAAHQALLEAEENHRFVSTRRRSSTAGLRTIIARGHAGDIARLEALIAHLAQLLAGTGDTDPAQTRRAKALAMLANPAQTCLFLARTHPTATPSPEPAPEPSSEPSSAVELAAVFGHLLRELGAKAIDRLRPRSVLYLHLAAEAVHRHHGTAGLPGTAGILGTAVARVEDPLAGGPISLDQLRSWLAHDHLTLTPVLDPTQTTPVDSYEIPRHLREALALLTPYETFPYGTQPTREADLDHTIPYAPPDRDGPPEQTALTNLGPLGRRHHLAKTFGRFTVHQPALGLYYWRTPTGHWYRVDHRGTTHLGRRHPPVLDHPALHPRSADRTRMEEHLRDHIVRHLAA